MGGWSISCPSIWQVSRTSYGGWLASCRSRPRGSVEGDEAFPNWSCQGPVETPAGWRHATMSSPSDEATIGEKQELLDPGQGTPPDEFEKINVDTPLPELEIRVKMTGLDGEHVSWLLGKALSVVLSPVPDDRWPRNTAIAFAGELKPVTAKSFYLLQAPRPSPSGYVSALIRSPCKCQVLFLPLR